MWKEMANALLRGYSNFGFESWTVPCLYVTGRFLRIFAIKADEESDATSDNSASFHDDIDADSGKNKNLEDAARVLNRIFTLCLSDRFVFRSKLRCYNQKLVLTLGIFRASLEESRKWGIYYIINLLFKTYFKLNSISLSKNILRALQATRGDMPELEAFPKSHQVTFKYYVGVIHFLEESYVEVFPPISFPHKTLF